MALQGDYLVRATAFDGQIRAFAVRTTETLQEITNRLDLWATASAAVGRTISAGAMMGAMLKGKERLTISIHGNGPIGRIVVDANAKGEVRGYATNLMFIFHPMSKGNWTWRERWVRKEPFM
ncbi:33 kDa chaperonin (fragment 1) [[Clostridium] ultunense Esp]|nr:33 kDa chaperonin (fragment 1) [[Clostridium] ultunense Esp]